MIFSNCPVLTIWLQFNNSNPPPCNITIFIGPESDHCPVLSLSVSFCSCWDLIVVTLASEDSRTLSSSYQLLSVLTAMLLTLEQNKSHNVDVCKKQKPWCWCQKKVLWPIWGWAKNWGAFFAPPLHSGSKRDNICMIETYLVTFQAVVSSTTGSMYIAEE